VSDFTFLYVESYFSFAVGCLVDSCGVVVGYSDYLIIQNTTSGFSPASVTAPLANGEPICKLSVANTPQIGGTYFQAYSWRQCSTTTFGDNTYGGNTCGSKRRLLA
jgi:hypothetical protein